MNLAVAMLVLADLLVRGAAVPHVHPADAGDHAESHRPHVHLTWHSHHADHARDHGEPADEQAVVYLDAAVMIFETPHGAAAASAEVAGATPAIGCPCVPAAPIGCIPAPARPPGERAASIHDFLPHVLRI